MIRKFQRKANRLLNKTVSGESGQEIVKGSFFALANRLLGMGVNFLFIFVMARGFGATGTGIYTLCQTVLQFFANIGKLGSDTLMTRFTAQYKTKNQPGAIKDLYNKSLWLAIPLSLVLSVVFWLLAPWIAEQIFNKPHLTKYYRLASWFVLPLVLFSINAGSIRGLKKSGQYAFIHNVSNYAAGVIIMLSFLLFTRDLYVPVLTYGLSLTFTAILSGIWWFKGLNYFKIKAEKTFDFNEKMAINMSLFLTAMFSLVRGWSDSFILGIYDTEAEVGIYRSAFKISTLTRITLTAILIPAAPKFAELFSQGKMHDVGKSAQFTTKLIFWTSAPILIFMILFPQVFLWFLGPEFIAGATALIILSIGQFINASTGPVGNILMMTGKQKIVTWLHVVAAAICIGLDFLLIPKYGKEGAAMVNAIGVLIIMIPAMIMVRYHYGFFTFDIREIVKINPRTFLKELKQATKRQKKKKTDAEKEQAAEDQIDGMDV